MDSESKIYEFIQWMYLLKIPHEYFFSWIESLQLSLGTWTFFFLSLGCGADLTNPTGSFVSPNYPNQYSHNAECFWTISISRGSRIHLTFVDFNFENHVTCQYDYVEVWYYLQVATPFVCLYVLVQVCICLYAFVFVLVFCLSLSISFFK